MLTIQNPRLRWGVLFIPGYSCCVWFSHVERPQCHIPMPHMAINVYLPSYGSQPQTRCKHLSSWVEWTRGRGRTAEALVRCRRLVRLSPVWVKERPGLYAPEPSALVGINTATKPPSITCPNLYIYTPVTSYRILTINPGGIMSLEKSSHPRDIAFVCLTQTSYWHIPDPVDFIKPRARVKMAMENNALIPK